MSDKLTHFLIDLASDSIRMDAFLADPAGMLATSLLTDEEKRAVLTRDGHRVRSALGFSLAMPEPVAVMKKRPPTLKDQNTNDSAKPAANKQRKPGSKKGSPAARKGGRK